MSTSVPGVPSNRLASAKPRFGFPTNKWLVALVAGLGAIATMYATTHGWDVEESVALIGLIVERTASYLTPNDPTPGGVPNAR